MARWTAFLSVYSIFFIILSAHDVRDKFGTEEIFRKNIIDLSKNRLNFSDDSIPFYENELEDATPEQDSEYDFIVIGAGSAGATLASRLSEIENATILLIEAGPKEYPIMDVPALAGFLQSSDEVNWKYKSEKSNKYCRGFKESKCNLPRGRVMGGSSVLNFMVATRGHRENYDEWAAITGDKSWSYAELLKYFKKMENFHIEGHEYNDKLHGKDGPVHISKATYVTKFAEAFIEAGTEMGYTTVDYNGLEQIGFSLFQSTIMRGERWSSNRAYLHFAEKRKNLFLTRNSHVNKVLIDDKTKSAYGVEFVKNGKKIQVKARKEVVLSAGAIGSPQLLMLSGIGPADHLQSLDINVVVDSPVGENLRDHIIYGGLVFKTNVSLSPIEADILDPNNPSIKDFLMERSGPLTLNLGFEALAFVNVNNHSTMTGSPNVELIFGAHQGIKDPGLANVFGIKEEYQKEFVENSIDHYTWSIWPALTQPKSRGKLMLQSKDSKVKPKLLVNYFEDPEDVRIMIQGIRYAISLGQTNAFKKYDSKLYEIPLPCQDYKYDSDGYWECALRLFGTSVYHQVGTCKMGSIGDSTSVVNSRLEVIGVKKLRVVDASIMPNIISGHTNLPAIAIAEKASDMIKSAWS